MPNEQLMKALAGHDPQTYDLDDYTGGGKTLKGSPNMPYRYFLDPEGNIVGAFKGPDGNTYIHKGAPPGLDPETGDSLPYMSGPNMPKGQGISNMSYLRTMQEKETRDADAKKKADAKAAADKAAADKAAADKAAQAAAQAASQNSAYNTAKGYGAQQVKDRGFDQGLIDKYGVLDLYGSAVDKAKAGMGGNPSPSYNTGLMFNDALSAGLTKYRGDIAGQIGSITPEGFASDWFGDTADDDILNTILGTQRTAAEGTLSDALARGQINQQKYDQGILGLDTQGAEGMDWLQGTGGDILGGYRSKLDAFRTGELSKVGNYSFDNPFNFDAFNTNANKQRDTYTGQLQGDITNAVGNRQFFDPNSLIGGLFNPTSAPTGGSGQTGGENNPLLSPVTNNTAMTPNKNSVNGVF